MHNNQISNPTLLSGFLSAIFSFGTESLNDQMAKLTLEGINDRLECYIEDAPCENCDKLIVVGVLTNSIESQIFHNFAEKILMEFRTQFDDSIIHWDGNLNKFDLFTQYVIYEIRHNFLEEDPELEDDTFDNQLGDVLSRITKGDLSAINNLEGYLDSIIQ